MTDLPPDRSGAANRGDARVRPFLGRLPEGAPRSPLPPAEDAARVRSFMMTGGRAQTQIRLDFESMVSLTERGLASRRVLRFERGRIAELCLQGALSVAELSARLAVPIGVARVIAADMVSEGLLDAHLAEPNLADDVSLISRLIHGVRAL